MIPYVLGFVWTFSSLVLAQLTVNTPVSVVQCLPVLLNWNGGIAPYYVTVLPGGQPGAAPLESLSSGTSGTSLTWNVDIAAGTEVTIGVRDSTGSVAYSALVTIQSGSSSSCLGNAGGSSASASAAGASSIASAVAATSASASQTSAAVTQPSASIAAATLSASTPEGSLYSGSSVDTASASGTTSQSTTSIIGGLVAQTNVPDSPSSSNSKSNSKTIAIAVGVVAGLLSIAVAVLIYLLVRRNRRRRDHLFDVDPSPVDQHGGGIVGGRLGMEVPHMYHAASAIVPFVPSSAAAGGQAIDDSSKVEQPWNESSQSDISPPYLTSSSQPQQPQQSSSNVASEFQSDLGNPLERASFSSQPSYPQRVGGRGLVSPEKSALPGLPPGASPPIPGGMEGVGRVATPEAASMYRQAQSPPPQYEG
ncbi:hypothetical protein FRB94_008186 [Tulasnella sp. JGI-2019a]|nr:hypothetical protein FRB93_007708 [Tulasnella sp. JGI-2019a]KAG8996620.1 hypothetical protein FRB94_008186 [Tulasnella sp. JGI-2019a]